MKGKSQLKVFLVRLAKAERDGERDPIAEKAVERLLKINEVVDITDRVRATEF